MIHPTAIVDPRARIPADATIAEFCVIRGDVTLGPGTVVHPFSVLCGTTIIGARCKIGPSAIVGADPQHKGYTGYETRLVVGDDTIIRESATLHRSFKTGDGHATVVGSRCFLMAGAHVGHDARVADDVTLANDVLLGGHVDVGAGTFMGGASVVHQFCRIGRLVMVGGGEIVTKDVPPFAAMRWGGLKGYNAIGCRRSGMSREDIFALRAAFHTILTRRSVLDAVADLETGATPHVREIIDFVRGTKRGVHPSVRFLTEYRASDRDED